MLHSVLSMQNVSKSFVQGHNVTSVLSKATFDFKQGDSYAIMGSSGSGKSTCIHLLSGIDVSSGGNVFLDNISVTSIVQNNPASFFQKDIGVVFQQPCLFAELTVLENVMLKHALHATSHKQDIDKALSLLDEVGLKDKASFYPAALSGGQQQRVALLRAIFLPPKFLLVDEPTGNLDQKLSSEVVDLLLHYQQKYNIGLIVSTHDKLVANRMKIRLIVENKKLVQRG